MATVVLLMFLLLLVMDTRTWLERVLLLLRGYYDNCGTFNEGLEL